MRTVARATLLVTVVAVLAAVGWAGPRVSLEFWTISLQPFFAGFITGLIGAYEAVHPDVDIRWMDVQIQAIEQKLLAAIAGGVAPDVVNLSMESAARVAARGALVDMDSAVPASEREKYFDGLWASTRVRGRSSGIPWYVAPPVLVYNADLFRRAGLDPLEPPASEGEMVAAAIRIKDRTGVYGFMPLVDGTRLLYRFQENGLPVLSPDGRRAVFNSPAHVAYLQQYVQLFKDDYFPDDTLRRGFLGAVERYSAGQLGMLVVEPQFLERVKVSNPEVYARTFVGPYPVGKARIIHAGLMVLAVPRASRRVAEAVRFALYVTGDDNQLAFSRLVAAFPSTRRAASDPFFRQKGAGPEWKARAIAAGQLRYARDLNLAIPNQGEVYRIFREAVESAFFGRMSAKDALDWAVREWNARL